MHARLLSGTSLTVTSDIAETFLAPVSNSLRKEFSSLSDPHSIDMAVIDALTSYFDRPDRFDSGRAGLFTYLRWLAKSRLLNFLAKEKKVVELDAIETVYEEKNYKISDPEDTLTLRESDDATWRKLREILTDPVDLGLVKLMMEGIRETAPYAALLSCSSLSADQQTKVVKRHKDRIKKTLQRKYRREVTR